MDHLLAFLGYLVKFHTRFHNGSWLIRTGCLHNVLQKSYYICWNLYSPFNSRKNIFRVDSEFNLFHPLQYSSLVSQLLNFMPFRENNHLIPTTMKFMVTNLDLLKNFIR